MKPKVTVYIACHNYARFLVQSVDSVLQQTMTDWELLIINDGSTDDTRQVMEIYTSDPRIRLFHTEGIGLPGVCNLALKEANGEYLIRLDGDDVFEANILLVLANYLDRHEAIALVFPDFFLMDSAGFVFSQERREPVLYSNHMLDMPPNGACTLVRKNVLQELGGYREDLGAQDGFDLWARVNKQYPCGNVNVPLFYYRRHGGNLTETTQRIVTARRVIKQDATSADLTQFEPITAVIPCRRFYDFCPDLWSEMVGEKSLLERAIESCLKVSLLDHIVVTSDTDKTVDTINKYSDSRLKHVARSTDHTIRSKPVAYSLDLVRQKLDLDLKGITLLVVATAPFLSPESIEEAINTLVLNDCDSVSAVEIIAQPLYKRGPHGLESINPQRGLISDFDTIYADTRTCVATRNSCLRDGSITGSRVVHFEIMDAEKFGIRNSNDLIVARSLVKGNRPATDGGPKRDASI